MPRAHRQTLSYLRELFDRHGIAPRKRYGQNFLIDLNIHDVIVEAAELAVEDIVLEVGPGTGALTAAMATRAGRVIAVEIDPAMARLASETVSEAPQVRVLNLDALARKSRIAPEVLDALRDAKQDDPTRSIKLVANLPYNVATPLISNLLVLDEPTLCPSRMVITIQLELARKMLAAPGSNNYGGLSVLVQSLGQAEMIRELPPSVFWPRPQVDSAIVRIDVDPSRRQAIGDLPWFHWITRMIFLQRRKNLRRVLHSYYRDRYERSVIDDFLERQGHVGMVRAETLDVPTLIRLASAIQYDLGTPRDYRGAADLDAGESVGDADSADAPDTLMGTSGNDATSSPDWDDASK